MNPSTEYYLILSFTQEEKDNAEKKAKISSNSNSSTYSYNTELNYLCSKLIIKWLEEEVKIPNISNAFSNTESEIMYQFINGTAINIEGERRLIIIPSSCIEPDTMTVPQEWVDIFPADYYLALEVDLDENLIMSYGFCTHAQLKQKAEYDPSFRKYELDGNDMIDDIVVLLVSLKQQIQERAPININLSSLPSTFNVESIINYDCGIAMSRLLVPFETWGAVWANDELRKQLYKYLDKKDVQVVKAGNVKAAIDLQSLAEKITSAPKQKIVYLKQLLQGIFEDGWLPEAQVMALGARGRVAETRNSSHSSFGKTYKFNVPIKFLLLLLELNCLAGLLFLNDSLAFKDWTLALIVEIEAEENQEKFICVNVYPKGKSRYLPSNLNLKITLNPDSPSPKSKEKTATEELQGLYIRFHCSSGEKFKVELLLENIIKSEVFEV